MTPARRPVDLAQRLLPFQQVITMPAHETYCVYTHSYKGTVFYVGMGRPERPFHQQKRSPHWQAYVRALPGPYEIAIVLSTEKSKLASKEEKRLIRQYQPVCNLTSASGLRKPPPPQLHVRPAWMPRMGCLPVILADNIWQLGEQEGRSYHDQIETLVLEALGDRVPSEPLQWFELESLCQRALDLRGYEIR